MNNRMKMLSIALLGTLIVAGNSMQAMNSDTVQKLVQAAAQTACNNSDTIKSALETSRDATGFLSLGAFSAALWLCIDELPPIASNDPYYLEPLAEIKGWAKIGAGLAALAVGSNLVKNALPQLCAWVAGK